MYNDVSQIKKKKEKEAEANLSINEIPLDLTV